MNIFPSFERACLVTHAITLEMTNAYDNQRLPQYAKRYLHASKLVQEQLHTTPNQSGILRPQPPPKL